MALSEPVIRVQLSRPLDRKPLGRPSYSGKSRLRLPPRHQQPADRELRSLPGQTRLKISDV